MLEFLMGKKTYLAAILLFIAAGAKGMGLITPEQYEVVMGVLGALGLSTLRAGVTKSGPVNDPQ